MLHGELMAKLHPLLALLRRHLLHLLQLRLVLRPPRQVRLPHCLHFHLRFPKLIRRLLVKVLLALPEFGILVTLVLLALILHRFLLLDDQLVLQLHLPSAEGCLRDLRGCTGRHR